MAEMKCYEIKRYEMKWDPDEMMGKDELGTSPHRQPIRNARGFPPIKVQTPYIYLSVIRANRSSTS